MKMKLGRSRDGLRVTIAPSFAKRLGLSPGDTVDVTVERKRIVVTPPGVPRFTLRKLLRKMTPQNLHGEQFLGGLRGKELI